MRALLISYIAALTAFVVLDAFWLLFIAAEIFQAEIGALLRPEPLLAAAAAFYLIYIAAVVVLAVAPAIQQRSAGGAMWRGAVFGLAAYATFDLTNLAVLSGWSVYVSLVDMIWGTGGTALAALAGYLGAATLAPKTVASTQ